MIEIIVLYILAGKIGKIVQSKGRKKIGYQLMLIGMWIGGEVLGAIIGGVVAAIADMEEAGGLLAVAFALGGAITGAVIAFQIAKSLSSLDSEEEEFYRGIDHADSLQAREHFRARAPAPPPTTDAYTDGPENPPRPADNRIQE
jgi:hypothetical protein